MESRRVTMKDMSKQQQQEEEEEAGTVGVSPLSEVLWKEKAVSNSAAARLAWEEVAVAVPVRTGEALKLLDGLSGYAEPGTITVVMGPSGSGKSTLLDALSGRLAVNAFLSGSVFLNGRKLARLPLGAVAYVTQDDDNLIGTLTVRETLMYSARLRLPDKMSTEERRALVESTIVEMGLQDCAYTPIGNNWHSRGISGGEKRRVSIALEILTRPRLLFLDEPTSGLDSASAFYVTQTLRNLSRDGRTVIASVHQPSSEVYQLFDRLYLLSGGKTVFFGEVSQAHEFFAQAGFPCPSRRNPSDHFLRCINSDFDKVKSALKGCTKGRLQSDDPLDSKTTTEVTQRLVEFYNHSQYYYTTRSKVDEISRLKGSVMDFGGSQASFLVQASTLTERSFVNMTRDIGYYWLRLATYIVVSVCIGTLFINVGTKFTSIRARSSSAFFILTFLTFMSIGGFPSFAEDLKVFHKERLNGYYGVSAFVIGNTLSSAPFLMLIAFVSGTISYFMVGLHPGFSHYLFFNLCLCASVFVVESMMMAIASVLPNFLMGVMIGAGIQGIFLMVSGYFRRIDDIPKPVWRYPMTYISFHYWDLQGAYLNDMRGLTFDNSNPDLPKIPGEYVLENTFMVDLHRSKWWDLTVLLAMVVAYRILFFVMIKLSEDVTPRIRGYIARKRLTLTRASTVF